MDWSSVRCLQSIPKPIADGGNPNGRQFIVTLTVVDTAGANNQLNNITQIHAEGVRCSGFTFPENRLTPLAQKTLRTFFLH